MKRAVILDPLRNMSESGVHLSRRDHWFPVVRFWRVRQGFKSARTFSENSFARNLFGASGPFWIDYL